MKFYNATILSDSGLVARLSKTWPIVWAIAFLILLLGGVSGFTAGIALGFVLMLLGATGLFYVMVAGIETEFDFLRLLAVAAAGFVSLGTLNNIVYTSLVVDQSWASSLSIMDVTPRFMAFAGALLILYCGALSTAAWLFFHNPSLAVMSQIHARLIQRVRGYSFDSGFIGFSLITSILICGLQVYALKTGLYAFRGMTAEDGVLSPVAVIIITIVPMAPFLAGMIIGKMRSRIVSGLPAIVAAAVILIFQLCWALLGGRTGVILVVMIALVGVQVVNPIRRIGFGLIIAFILLALMTKPLLDFYQFARFRDLGLMEVGKSDPVGFIFENWREYGERSEQEKAEHNELISENIANRGTVLSYFAQYLKFYSENSVTPLLGRCMFNSFLTCIPRVFFPGKVNVAVAEYLYYEQQGFFPTADGADSFYMEAFIDFHVVGYVIYPLVMTIAVAFTLLAVAHLGGSLGSIFAFALITRTMIGLGAEGAQGSYYAVFRNVLIVVVLLIPLDRFIRGKRVKGAESSADKFISKAATK